MRSGHSPGKLELVPISFHLTPKSEDTPYALHDIARDHYVGARLSFVGSTVFPAHLLMEQCAEVAVKSLLLVSNPQRTFGGRSGHHLRALLREATQLYPSLSVLDGDRDVQTVIDVLEGGYNPVRYGESILGVNLGGFLRAADRLAWVLLAEGGRALRYLTPLSLRVGDAALPSFLWRLRVPVENVRRQTDAEDEWSVAEVILVPPWLASPDQLRAAGVAQSP
jgi:hypothetical protein